MVIVSRFTSLLLNSFFNKCRISKYFFSFCYSNPFRNWKKRYLDHEKEIRKLPPPPSRKINSGRISKQLEGRLGDKTNQNYVITISEVGPVSESNELLIRKTIGKPKNAVPLTFIENTTQGKPFETKSSKLSGTNLYWAGPAVLNANKNNTTVKKPSTLPSENIVLTTPTSGTGAHVVDLKEYLQLYYSNKLTDSASINEPLTEQHYSPLDTIVLNPIDPNSRIILYFKNKNVQVIEPSNFDNLNLAHQHIVQSKSRDSLNASRINFVKFEKVSSGYPQSLGYSPDQKAQCKVLDDLVDDSEILKIQKSICLESINNRCWIPTGNDSGPSAVKLPGVTFEAEADQLAEPVIPKEEIVSKQGDDTAIIETPTKKNNFIDDTVAPTRSILEIINSIDRSTIIINKDLYITDRIIQKIKDEENKEENKTLKTKGVATKSGGNNLQFSSLTFPEYANLVISLCESEILKLKDEEPNSENLTFLQELSSKFESIVKILSSIPTPLPDCYLVLPGLGNEGSELLLFSLTDAPVMKGTSNTDIIKKAAAIIQKEKYSQKKIEEDMEKPKKEIPLTRVRPGTPSPTKPTEGKEKFSACSEPLLAVDQNSEIVKIEPLSFSNFSKISNDSSLKNCQEHKVLDTAPCVSFSDANCAEVSEIHVLKNDGNAKPEISLLNFKDDQFSSDVSKPNNDVLYKNENHIECISNSIVNTSGLPSPSLIDQSAKCLMSSKSKTGGSDVKGTGKTNLSLVKNSSLQNKEGSEHITQTSITVTKKNNVTDINIIEKETFTDSRFPVPFSTETFFQVYGSTSTIQKEVNDLIEIKKALMSSLYKNNSSKGLPENQGKSLKPTDKNAIPTQKLDSSPVNPLDSTSTDGGTVPVTVQPLSRGKPKILRKVMKKDKRNISRRKRSGGKLSEKNDTSATIKTEFSRNYIKKSAVEKLKKDIEKIKEAEVAKSVLDKTKNDFQKVETKQTDRELTQNNGITADNYVLLQESSKKPNVVKTPKRKPRSITGHKSLSKRDKKILKDILKENIKKMQSTKVKRKSVDSNLNSNEQYNKSDTKSRTSKLHSAPSLPSGNISETVRLNSEKAESKTKLPEETSKMKSDTSKMSTNVPEKINKLGKKDSLSNNNQSQIPSNRLQENNAVVNSKSGTVNISADNYKLAKNDPPKSPRTKMHTYKAIGSPKISASAKLSSPKKVQSPKKIYSPKSNSPKKLISSKKPSSAKGNHTKTRNKANTLDKKEPKPELKRPDTKTETESSASIINQKPKKNLSTSTGSSQIEKDAAKNTKDYKKNENSEAINKYYSKMETLKATPLEEKGKVLVTIEKNITNDTNKSQITVLERVTPQNSTNINHKENFQNNLLEKIKSKIEKKNPINYRAKNFMPHGSKYTSKVKSETIIPAKNSSHTNFNSLNPLEKINSSHNKLPVSNIRNTKAPKKQKLEQKNLSSKRSLAMKKVPHEIKDNKERPKIKQQFSKSKDNPDRTTLSLRQVTNKEKYEPTPKNTEKNIEVSAKKIEKKVDLKLKNHEEKKSEMQKDPLKKSVNVFPAQKESPNTVNNSVQVSNSEKPRNTDFVKPANIKPIKSPEQKGKLNSYFPTLLVDLDKMAKESKPDFDKKNFRSCIVPLEKVTDYPIWHPKKPQEPLNPQSVIKVCPSKDSQLRKDLILYPSVSKILNVTLPSESKQLMKNWWKAKQSDLGEKGFRNFYKDEVAKGNQFHNLVQDRLLWGSRGDDAPSSLYFKSLQRLMKDFKDLSVINSHVIHRPLAYRGVIDCIAKYKKKPVLIEWKRLDRQASSSRVSLENAFQQLSAYVGAVNYDTNYNFQVKGGILVLAFSDGSEAQMFHLKGVECEQHWKSWLERLHKFHKYFKNKNKQHT